MDGLCKARLKLSLLQAELLRGELFTLGGLQGEASLLSAHMLQWQFTCQERDWTFKVLKAPFAEASCQRRWS